jgi:hypothetical protein
MFGSSAFSEAPFASQAGQNITVALTGVSGSGNAGSVTAQNAPALTGVSASGAVGSVTTSRTIALTGVVASGFAN